MIGKTEMDKYRWKGKPPNIKDIELIVPAQFISCCPNVVGENNAIDYAAISQEANMSFYNQLTSWSSQQLIRLRESPGILLVKVPEDKITDKQLKSLYYIISKGLGDLNSRYGELFEVRDRNLDYTKAAIPVSKTNATTGFHTDSTALEYSPDIVGLLCLQPAEIGGESIVTNAADLYLWMKRGYPEFVKVLKEPIIRDIITPGSETNLKAIKKNRFPVFSFDSYTFKFRYMRYWIISGHKRCQIKISPPLMNALDKIEEFFQKKENLLFYKMERGDMLFINNNFICHNRTKYEDQEEKGIKRTLLRTWINF